VEGIFAETQLSRFRPLLKSVQNDDQVAERLKAVPLPGHAPGHTGYAFDAEEDHFLFFGDVVHMPALQFGHPALSLSTP
jgi:glyoxylase-like metal-dependent hydrolase (beta-lactamase superfamily II)